MRFEIFDQKDGASKLSNIPIRELEEAVRLYFANNPRAEICIISEKTNPNEANNLRSIRGVTTTPPYDQCSVIKTTSS